MAARRTSAGAAEKSDGPSLPLALRPAPLASVVIWSPCSGRSIQIRWLPCNRQQHRRTHAVTRRHRPKELALRRQRHRRPNRGNPVQRDVKLPSAPRRCVCLPMRHSATPGRSLESARRTTSRLAPRPLLKPLCASPCELLAMKPKRTLLLTHRCLRLYGKNLCRQCKGLR